jgi:peptide/nickel transport system substrate-binding protein
METVMKPRRFLFSALALLALLLGACAPRVVTVTVTSPPETVVVTATPRSTATPSPSPAPEGPKVLNVCLVGEPDTLYLYGGSQLAAAQHVMEALYDGPIDHRGYAYQPVILEKIPSLADGDAVRRRVVVRQGERVVDADGQVVELDEGVQVRPSRCYTTGCEVTFERGMLAMDRLEVTFTLRRDVTWSDGEPLTAGDSAFAFEVASDPATPGYRYLTERTARYRAVDPWRTKWVGVPGFVDPSYALHFFPPLPRHQLEDLPPSRLPAYEGTRRAPLGWGAFVVDEWVRGDHIALSRNPEYFRADEGLPYLDKVVFKVKADAEDVTAALLSGSCDFATHDADFSSLMPLLVRLEGQDLPEVASAPGGSLALLSFGIQSSGDDERPGFFAEPRVRQAIAKCVDRQALLDEVTYGRSVAPDSYLPPEHPQYPTGELTRWTHDLAGGRALLDEIGWRDVDDDGVREAQDVEGVPDGEPFEVTLLASADGELSQEAARILRAQLADCGVRVTLDARPRWELFAEGPEGPLFGRRFDLVVATWELGDRPHCERYLSSEIPEDDAWSGVNITGYESSSYDAACHSAQQALPGSLTYDRYHEEAQVIFSQDLPALPLFVPLRVALVRPLVENFAMDATAESELWSLESLDVGSAVSSSNPRRTVLP